MKLCFFLFDYILWIKLSHKWIETALYGELIMLKVTSHKCAAPHEHLTLISLKQAIYYRPVQLGELDESDVDHLYKQD